MSTEGRLQGRVKWFNNKSGYGFISTLGEDSKDIFAHYSGIRGYTPDRTEGKFNISTLFKVNMLSLLLIRWRMMVSTSSRQLMFLV